MNTKNNKRPQASRKKMESAFIELLQTGCGETPETMVQIIESEGRGWESP